MSEFDPDSMNETGGPDNPSGPPSLPVYCSFRDMEVYGRQWLRDLQTDDDLPSYESQRNRARTWLDDLILDRWRVSQYLSYNPYSVGNSCWQGSQLIRRQFLDQNFLVVRGWTIEATAKKALSLICESQIGPGDSGAEFRKMGRMFSTQADAIAMSNVAEIANTPNSQPIYRIDLGSSRI